MNLQERQQKIIQDFSSFNTWEDRYKKVIEIGKALPVLDADLKIEENKIKGCQSQVWLVAQLTPEGRIQFQGDSDALIVKGLVGLLLQIYSDSTPEEILNTPVNFIKEIGFEGNLSPSRANGLVAMMKQIRNYATAFSVMLKMKK